MKQDYDLEYDTLENAPKDITLPPTADSTKPSVQIWSYLAAYNKTNFEQRFSLAKIKRASIQHNITPQKKGVFQNDDFQALRDLNKPEILAAASPPDPKVVKSFFDIYGGTLGYDVPVTLRTEFFKLAKPEILPFKSRATMIDQETTDMFFVCQGTALQCGTEEIYQDFCDWENHKGDEQRMMGEVRGKPNWSNMAKVGRCLLAYLLKNRTVKMTVDFKKEFIAAKEFEEQCSTLNGLKKIDEGQCFGDFEIITGKPFKRQVNIAMKAPTLVLRITSADVAKLFANSLLPENMSLIQSALSEMRLKPVLMKKLSRCFITKELPPKMNLIREGKPLQYIYILKKGTCTVQRDQDPFNVEIQPAPVKKPKEVKQDSKKKKEVEINNNKSMLSNKVEQKGNESDEYLEEKICLAESPLKNFGLTESNVSRSMRRFNIMDLEEGSLIGEEALFTKNQKLNYSVHTVNACTVFCIAIDDFRQRCSKEYLNTLRDNCLKNQIQRLLRIRQIHQSSGKFREENDHLSKFYAQSIKTINKLHPHASKKIAKYIEQEFVLEGVIRTTRDKSSVNVGELSLCLLDDIKRFESAKKASQAAMSDKEQQDLAFTMHKKRDANRSPDEKITPCPCKVFKGQGPVSPTGVPLVDERKGRQQRLEVKSKHIAEGDKKQMKPSLSSITCELVDSPSHTLKQNPFNSVDSLQFASQMLPAANSPFKYGSSNMISVQDVPAVQEIADSENYTEFAGSQKSSRMELGGGETDELPREMMDSLLQGDQKLEDKPIYIKLPTDQVDREKKTPLLEWRAQTVDLQYKERGITYLKKYKDPNGDRSCIIYNKKAAEKQKHISLNTPRPAFLLPSSTPAVSQRYGQDYEASPSPTKKLPQIKQKLNSPSMNSISRSRFQPESPVSQVIRNSMPTKCRARTWNQILQSSAEKSSILHQSSLYRGQMVTDKLKKSLQISAFDMQEQKLAADKYAYLKAQIFAGNSSQLNQGSSTLMMSLGESLQASNLLPSVQLPSILNSPSELRHNPADHIEASFRSEVPSVQAINSSLFVHTNTTAINELKNAMEADIEEKKELMMHQKKDSVPVSIVNVQQSHETSRNQVYSNTLAGKANTAVDAEQNQDLEYDEFQVQPKKTGRLIIVPPMKEGSLGPLDIDLSAQQSNIEGPSARNAQKSLQDSDHGSHHQVRSSGGTKFSVHSKNEGGNFPSEVKDSTDGFYQEDQIDSQFDLPVQQVLNPQRFSMYSGKKGEISKEAKEIEDFNVYIRDKKRQQQKQNRQKIIQKQDVKRSSAHLSQTIRHSQNRAMRMSSIAGSSCQNYNFEQNAEIHNKSTGPGFTIKQVNFGSKPDPTKTMRQGHRQQFSLPREKIVESPQPTVNKNNEIIEHPTRKNPYYQAPKILKKVESTDKIITSETTPLLPFKNDSSPGSAQSRRSPSLETCGAANYPHNLSTERARIDTKNGRDPEESTVDAQSSPRRTIFSMQKQQEQTGKKKKQKNGVFDSDAKIAAEFNEQVFSLQSQMEQNNNSKVVPYRLQRQNQTGEKESPRDQQSHFGKQKVKISSNSNATRTQKVTVMPYVTRKSTQKVNQDLPDSSAQSALSPRSDELTARRDKMGTGGRSYAKIVSHLNSTEDENKQDAMQSIRKHIIKKLKRRKRREKAAAYYSQPPFMGESTDKFPGKKRVAINIVKRGAANDSDVESEHSRTFSGLNQISLGPIPGSVQGRNNHHSKDLIVEVPNIIVAQNLFVSSNSELRQLKQHEFTSGLSPDPHSPRSNSKGMTSQDSKGQYRKHSSLQMTASEMANRGINDVAGVPTSLGPNLFGAGLEVPNTSKNEKSKNLPSSQGKEISTSELKQQHKSRKVLVSQGQI